MAFRLKELWLDLCLRAWRSSETIAGLGLVLGWWYAAMYFDHLEYTSPRVPIPSTGQVVPMHWKTVVVYMTSQDAELDRYSNIGMLVISLFVLGGVALWRRGTKLN